MDLLSGLTKESTINFKKACQHSKHIAILIQHVDKPMTLQSLLEKNTSSAFISFELVYILLQVYYPLACLQDKFTHYDLHMSNVLIYELPKGECVQYSFVDYYTGDTITFKTRFLVKIIDYGRSYFYKDDTINSPVVYHELCGYQECKNIIKRPNKPDIITSECGSEFGFGILNIKDFYHIDSIKRNKSHDLRLFSDIMYEDVEIRRKSQYSKKIPSTYSSLRQICDDLIYDEHYGTPELESDPSDNEIRNVGDLYKRLLAIINEPLYIRKNEKTFGNLKCVCIFEINGQDQMVVT